MDLQTLSEQLVNAVPAVSEADFTAIVQDIFAGEFGRFDAADTPMKNQTLCQLLSVYWIVTDQYDEFIRDQAFDAKLSPESWQMLQDWAHNAVGVSKSASTLNAMLVTVAIMNLGKVKDFREEFACGLDNPMEALACILERRPDLVPSFCALPEGERRFIMTIIKNDFNFGQFIQAENVPASLVSLQECYGWPCVESSMGFTLFRIFVAMCGLFGARSLNGSVFMSEHMFRNFKVGLDSLMQLEHASPTEVYNSYLSERAKAQGLPFDTSVRKIYAQVRLACLARTFEPEGAATVCQAFESLTPEEQSTLTKYVSADGIEKKPGFLLFHSPGFLDNAKRNPCLGLTPAFKALSKIYTTAAQSIMDQDAPVATIMLNELQDLAKSAEDRGILDSAEFCITWDSSNMFQGVATLLPPSSEPVATSAL